MTVKMDNNYEPLVAIIVLNYNNATDTVACLESIFRQKYNRYKVILVDNCSTDDSVNVITEWAQGHVSAQCTPDTVFSGCVQPNVPKPIRYNMYSCTRGGYSCTCGDELSNFTIIVNGENKGFGAGNNVGIRFIIDSDREEKPEYIWFLNNDTLVKDDALRKLVDTIAESKQIAMAGSVLLQYNRPDRTQSIGGYMDLWGDNRGIGENLLINEIDECDISRLFALNGASFLASVNFIEQVGVFDEAFKFYCEEHDFAERAYRNGWKCEVALGSLVWHKGGGTTSKPGFQSRFGYYHGNRSKIIFLKKYYPWRLTYVLLNELRKFYHYFQGTYPQGKLQGIIDGLKY